jgi:hypothetical protein
VDPSCRGRLVIQDPRKIVGGQDRFIELTIGEANADLYADAERSGCLDSDLTFEVPGQ